MKKVTWFEFNRYDDDTPSVMGYAGSEPVEEYKGNNKKDLIEFLVKHQDAGTFLVADTRKIIPQVASGSVGPVEPAGTPVPDTVTQTPNWSARGATVNKIFLHNTAGSFAGSYKRLTTRYPRNNASAHLIIDRDGKVHKICDFDKTAWHVRGQNSNSIGIEIVASRPGHGMTEAQEKSVIRWCKYLLEKYSLTPEALDEHRNYNPTACPEWIWPTGRDFDRWVDKHFA